jgi:hypothetical protein
MLRVGVSAVPFWRRRQQQATTNTALGATIAWGWNEIEWGSSLEGFRSRFPRANKTDSGWWLTGDGPEAFCGVPMAHTQYGFNSADQLYLVTFIPDSPQRAQLTPAVLNALGAPSGMDAVWNIGDVTVEVKTAGVLAAVTHGRYARRA